MLKRLKNSFDDGVEKIRWFSSSLSDRLKIEYLVMKLLYQSEQLEHKRDKLMKTIGQRVYELKSHSDRHLLNDRVVMETLGEIEKINNEINLTRKKASEISGTL